MEIKEIISSGILEAYVTGIASPAESKQALEWVNIYPEIRSEVLNIEKTFHSYVLSQSVSPSPQLKERILQGIEFNNSASGPALGGLVAKVRSISPVWRVAAAAAMIFLIGSVILNIVYYTKYQDTASAYHALTKEMLAKNEKLDVLNQDMSVIQNKYSVPVALNGLQKSPEAAAKIFWMKNTGEVYIDPSNLPSAPSGKQYQLWAIVDGKPVDGGMIVSGKDGKQYHIQKMKTFGKVDAFAVTLEDTGGNPTPKGDMYVMGKL